MWLLNTEVSSKVTARKPGSFIQGTLLMQVHVARELDVDALLDTELEQHKDLVQGQLENGLRYVILPNAVPPERFEAHLEICAGMQIAMSPQQEEKLPQILLVVFKYSWLHRECGRECR